MSHQFLSNTYRREVASLTRGVSHPPTTLMPRLSPSWRCTSIVDTSPSVTGFLPVPRKQSTKNLLHKLARTERHTMESCNLDTFEITHNSICSTYNQFLLIWWSVKYFSSLIAFSFQPVYHFFILTKKSQNHDIQISSKRGLNKRKQPQALVRENIFHTCPQQIKKIK